MPDPVVPAAPAPTPAAPSVTATTVAGAQQTHISSDVAPAPAGPTMPEGGFEKFWAADTGTYNWEAHAKEQMWQQARGTPPASPPAPAPAPVTPAGPPPTTPAQAPVPADAAAAATATAAGVDLTAFNQYVATNGVASPEHLATFAAAGIPAEVVNDYVSTKMEQVATQQKTVIDYVGGQAAIDQLDAYMTGTLTPEQVSTFTKQLMDPKGWKATADWLLSSAGIARAGNQLQAGPNAQPTPATNTASFSTEAEFNTAVQDKRYKTDPVFREQVLTTLRNSQSLVKAGSQTRHVAGA